MCRECYFPVSALADCFGFSFYVGIYYKWPCVRHIQLYTRAHLASLLDTHQWPFSVGVGS